MPPYNPRSTDARLLYDVSPFEAAYNNNMNPNGSYYQRDYHRETPSEVKELLASIKNTASRIAVQYNPRKIRLSTLKSFVFRRLLSVTTILILLWIWVVYGAERQIFQDRFSSCEWDRWEKWPVDANPHHLVFVADPQLVDPHTYPGRPWPLSSLTFLYTDLYLHRSFSLIQEYLFPDTVLFLGDLFDGGREWATVDSKSPDKRYHKYKDNFWLKEYGRFGNIFDKIWSESSAAVRVGQPGRKMISSLPGNHDLGFAAGIQKPVRKRFNTYFGEGNRVDVIANHTFVSIDAVSLSAMDSQAGTDQELYQPTVDFLETVQQRKMRAAIQELRLQNGLSANVPYRHFAVETDDLAKDVLPTFNVTEYEPEFPTILLSHVPLYRAGGTPCGPLREHWPPTPPPKGQKGPVIPDDRNAIAVRAGYQYQNVLTPEVSQFVTEKIGKIQYAFSGDDHDYCDVVHMGYSGTGSGIREITVKSISWAMGVRKPGFLMVSLWNEVDKSGKRKPIQSSSKVETIQTHLCLLPDQLGLFIRYAKMFGFSMVVLAIRAAILAFSRLRSKSEDADAPILPTSSAETEKLAESSRRAAAHKATASESSTSSDRSNLFVRSTTARAKSVSPSPLGSVYGYSQKGGSESPVGQGKLTPPLISHAGYFGPAQDDRIKDAFINTAAKVRKPLKGWPLFWHELWVGLMFVGIPVFGWYFWLIGNG